MQKEEIYRPANIEFDVANSSIMPDNLGLYPTEKEATEFIHKNTDGFNQKITVLRFMDNFEKSELRKDYQDLLELKLPLAQRELMKANGVLEEAKKKAKDAAELVNSTMNEVQAIAHEVKKGVKEISLDDNFTWRLPFHGKYYFYTYMDKQLKLCKVNDIPDHEKTDLFNSTRKNEEFFDVNFGGAEPTIVGQIEVVEPKPETEDEAINPFDA